MGRLGVNQALSLEVIQWLVRAGVRTICLCPGGRNAPLVDMLDEVSRTEPPAVGGLEVLDFFEERSASFFALGRAKRDRRPVAIVTTSGTASAELLPALVEAHYSATPLIAVTADRPRTYRGTGAPQTIEQVNLFGPYVRASVDIDIPGALDAIGPLEPTVHLNVCFDEPLIEGTSPGIPWDAASGGAHRKGHDSEERPSVELASEWERLRSFRAPLVMLGALPDEADQEVVFEFCRAMGSPVLAEASSHLKARLGPLALHGGEVAARRGFERKQFDSVVRLGDIPSFRLWRDIEIGWRVPVLSMSRTPFTGLTHGWHQEVPRGRALPALAPLVASPFPEPVRRELLQFDREVTAFTDRLLVEMPASEPALVRRLSESVGAHAFVYLGNSLPIREWNQFASVEERHHRIGENRGANGIDGQLSSFLGGACPERENWAVVGDLTALYDLPSLWALRHLAMPVRIVVINNGGGRIFQRLFRNPRFQNAHSVRLEGWAAMWDVAYRRGLPPREAALDDTTVFEVTPDARQSEAFWEAMRSRVPA